MATEEEAMQAKIAEIAGKINRHKNAQISGYEPEPVYSNARAYPYPEPWRGSRGGYRGTYRGGRGGRGGVRAPIYRNKSLQLNGAPSSTKTTTDAGLVVDENDPPSDASNTTWVRKNDRGHRSIINPLIFEKEKLLRVKAMEGTRQKKLKEKDDSEKAKLMGFLQLPGNPDVASVLDPADGRYKPQLQIKGIRFWVTMRGMKLVKVLDPSNSTMSTPKFAMAGPTRFVRSKNGNMYRFGAVATVRGSKPIQKKNELCKTFNTTGSCSRGPMCRYIHDPSKVAICKEFLHKGSCPSGDSCDSSHELTPERTPACLHFVKGNCSNVNCRYTHVRVSPSALVCRSFGIYGYCEKGASCTERHVQECPDFSNTGICTTKGCKLLHRHKASIMRNNAVVSESLEDNDDANDVLSDDDVGSEDVDSDDLEEFFGDEGETDEDVPMQRDFVSIR